MDLSELRKKIDKIDEQILDLLNQRTEIVLDIGKLKTKTGMNYHDPVREQEVVDRLISLNQGNFPNKALDAVYNEIISACRSLEKLLTVAYLGPKASHTHIAAIKHFGSSVELKPVSSQGDVFREVETHRADYGILAIENSTEGAVNPTLDAFVKSNLLICSEVMVQISHYLLANCSVNEIEEVYSHPQVLAQCKNWLQANLRNARIVAASSSAEAAKLAVREKRIAAIGSRLAADMYGLNILAEQIQDMSNNTTRFLVIGHHHSQPTGDDKTSILFSVKHEAGALARALTLLALYGLNLTNIQLRPSGMKAWEYTFFVDVEGHMEDLPVKTALTELEKHSILVKTLGSYPKAKRRI
ncbi:prephenate dehydratase [Candidatus Poribacteria bacterium]|nr:prephenate dehydratase [Candidatus Poribacteria bacterium]